MNLSLVVTDTNLICFQEEDEVPDDETVNQMIARSEEEFEQFMVSPSPISTLDVLLICNVIPLTPFCFICCFVYSSAWI